jgi:hypothetical protein
MNMHLIADPKERNKRAQEKEAAVLSWLKTHTYSSTAILASVMGIQERAARTVLNRLVLKGYLLKHKYDTDLFKGICLWGISFHGLLHILTPDEVQTHNLRYYKKSKKQLSTIHYAITAQRKILLTSNQS